jgi:hypothetical protein
MCNWMSCIFVKVTKDCVYFSRRLKRWWWRLVRSISCLFFWGRHQWGGARHRPGLPRQGCREGCEHDGVVDADARVPAVGRWSGRLELRPTQAACRIWWRGFLVSSPNLLLATSVDGSGSGFCNVILECYLLIHKMIVVLSFVMYMVTGSIPFYSNAKETLSLAHLILVQ